MNTTGHFTDKAEIYAKYRPSYPNAYLVYFISENGLNEDSSL
ncbi:hypothetical protein HNO89_002732 [Sporosarcina luteola]|nr:hypothetical protein [Sporosarcina luteola]